MAKHSKNIERDPLAQPAAPAADTLEEGEPGPDALDSLEPVDAPPLPFSAEPAPTGKHSTAGVPDYQRKSRKMRKILIAVAALLALLLVALAFCAALLIKEDQTRAVQQAQSQQSDQALQQSEAKETAQGAKKTDVPNLISLMGMTQDEAVETLAHGATVSASREVNEEGNPVKSQATVTLTDEPADTRTGTPTVYLFFDEEGSIIRAGYSAGTSSLGYGSLSFADAVENEHIVEDTLAETGLAVPEGSAVLPDDKASYATYGSDGTTLTKESCTFSGTAEANGATYAWESVLLYDYTTANATGNLANTIRQIYVYVGIPAE